jgi:hypothetical protein
MRDKYVVLKYFIIMKFLAIILWPKYQKYFDAKKFSMHMIISMIGHRSDRDFLRFTNNLTIIICLVNLS